MTTEIAIMNKAAIALAADSAATITVAGPSGNNYKIFNSANKLFALSKYAPVGIMAYGNASLLGIPWETIIKMYREKLGNREFPTLVNYCDDFFAYLDKIDVSDDLQKQYLIGVAIDVFGQMRKQLEDWVEKEIDSDRNVSPKQVDSKLGEIIESELDRFSKLGDDSALSKTKRTNLKKTYRQLTQDVAENIFEKLPITPRMRSQLLTIAVNAASIGPSNQSGIVIAGFGTEDLFPKCRDHDVAAVFAETTIKKDGKLSEITSDMVAAILPFAQSSDVTTFMQGIGPDLMKFLDETFHSMMSELLPEKLCEEVSKKLGLSEQQKDELNAIAEEMCNGACDYAFHQFRQRQREKYVDPVLTATEFLNKSELAAMAETLVNLVSFRKQVTMEAETVGGPIDVAVITKGDGLVWIKRKHYFPPDLNHHFFKNYHRKENAHEFKK